jgi:uncharacterized caspase-like protein
MRIPQFVALGWLALACALTPAYAAEKRVALVIGNAAYSHADKPRQSDQRCARYARRRGFKFDVVYGEDLDLKALRQKIGQFAGRADNADVALVYFAGHGATFDDIPYVVPVDAEFTNLDEAPYELVAVETLIDDLQRAKGVRIAILDACRDNSAEQELKRSHGGAVTRGLAPMRNPGGLIIAYATQYLSTAALLNNIATPGLDVKDMFFKVGSEVDAVPRASSGRRFPSRCTTGMPWLCVPKT